MVSGYFACGKSREKIEKSIQHILQLILIAYSINLVRIFLQNGCDFFKTAQYLKDILSLRQVLLWLVLNQTLISGVAWFLFALLDCYLFVWLFYRLYQGRCTYYVMAAGFGMGICATLILKFICGCGFGISNVWMCGLPYFLMGSILHKRQKTAEMMSNGILISMVVAGAILKTAGYLTPAALGYLGDIAFACGLFVLALKYPEFQNPFLGKIGSQCAFYTYIMHPIFMHIFDAIYHGKSTVVLGFFRPIIVVCVTIATSFAWYACKKKLRSKK